MSCTRKGKVPAGLTFVCCRFGVVCSFVSNQYMQDGTEELTGNLNTSMADAQTYLKTTGKHVDTIFNVNYDQFEQTTFDILSSKCCAVALRLQLSLCLLNFSRDQPDRF